MDHNEQFKKNSLLGNTIISSAKAATLIPPTMAGAIQLPIHVAIGVGLHKLFGDKTVNVDALGLTGEETPMEVGAKVYNQVAPKLDILGVLAGAGYQAYKSKSLASKELALGAALGLGLARLMALQTSGGAALGTYLNKKANEETDPLMLLKIAEEAYKKRTDAARTGALGGAVTGAAMSLGSGIALKAAVKRTPAEVAEHLLPLLKSNKYNAASGALMGLAAGAMGGALIGHGNNKVNKKTKAHDYGKIMGKRRAAVGGVIGATMGGIGGAVGGAAYKGTKGAIAGGVLGALGGGGALASIGGVSGYADHALGQKIRQKIDRG